jgi:hypothetical protein
MGTRWLSRTVAVVGLVGVGCLMAACGHKSEVVAGPSDGATPRQGLARGSNAAKQSRPPISPTE